MQRPQPIASSGGWNVRSFCLDSGLKMIGECWDLADGGWLQVALPDGIKFSTSPLQLTSSGVSTNKGHVHWKVYQSTFVRTPEAKRAKSLESTCRLKLGTLVLQVQIISSSSLPMPQHSTIWRSSVRVIKIIKSIGKVSPLEDQG